MEKSEMEQVLIELKKYYDSSQYQKAHDLLLENQIHFDQGVWHYNIAILELKLNKPVVARIHLEKAKKAGFYSQELKNAYEQTLTQLQVKSIESPSDWIDELRLITSTLPYDLYVTISLSMLFLLLIFYKKMEKILRWIIALFIVGPLGFYAFYVKQMTTLITYQDEIIYSGPSYMFEQIQQLPKGAKFLTTKKYEQWYYIVYPSSHQGWILPKKVEQI